MPLLFLSQGGYFFMCGPAVATPSVQKALKAYGAVTTGTQFTNVTAAWETIQVQDAHTPSSRHPPSSETPKRGRAEEKAAVAVGRADALPTDNPRRTA